MICLVWSPGAAAHGNMNIGAFYAGGLDLLLHWQHALFILATGLWCTQQVEPYPLRLGCCATAGFAAGALAVLLGMPVVNAMLGAAIGFTLIGLAVAACLPVTRLWPLALALLAAFANGAGIGPDAFAGIDKPLLFVLGMTAGCALLLFYLGAGVARLPAAQWRLVGVRVIGSWVAAIGLMVCAFSVYQPATLAGSG